MKAYWLGLIAAIAGLFLTIRSGSPLILVVILSLAVVGMLALAVWDHREKTTHD